MIPSGISLQGYFEIDAMKFARKLVELKTDFIFIDVPFPLGEAAFLSLGVCNYFVPILTEDEFVLCVESAIDTIRMGKYLFQCTPLGFVLNRIKTPEKFNDEFVKDIENLLEIPCIVQIKETRQVSKSYGEVNSRKAFLAFEKFKGSEFSESISEMVTWILGKLPSPEKKNAVELIQKVLRK